MPTACRTGRSISVDVESRPFDKHRRLVPRRSAGPGRTRRRQDRDRIARTASCQRRQTGLIAMSLAHIIFGRLGLRSAALLGCGPAPDGEQHRQRQHRHLRRFAGAHRCRRHGTAHHPAWKVEGPVVGVADQRRSQAHRHHVHRAGLRHAGTGPGRGIFHAQPASLRARRRLPLRRPLRSVLHHPRLDHDLLHGDAVSHRHHQLRHAAADRRARRLVSGDELHQPRD